MAVLDPTSDLTSSKLFGAKKSITYNGHRIEMRCGHYLFHKVFYDGREVSKAAMDKPTTLVFTISEEGEEAQYVITLMQEWRWSKLRCEVRRNGKIIFTDL